MIELQHTREKNETNRIESNRIECFLRGWMDGWIGWLREKERHKPPEKRGKVAKANETNKQHQRKKESHKRNKETVREREKENKRSRKELLRALEVVAHT